MTTNIPIEIKPFRLTFANRVIEHLGIKLYQNKPANVVAEFVSNSWDADATAVDVDIKAGEGSPSIVITDNGRGMTRDELTDEFLIIGRNRRADPGERTSMGRLPMGRKGIGKLAGFGISRIIDVISAPNFERRGEPNSGLKVFWLRFDLAGVIQNTSPGGDGNYEPDVIADGIGLKEFEDLTNEQKFPAIYSKFTHNLRNGSGGVCVHLSDTTLKRAINTDVMLRAMGRRFTVTMLRPDFIVKINDKKITPADALPALHDFGYGSWDEPIKESIKIGENLREIKYWIRFVSLKDSEWSIEQAGIGVYAHGKIAQDRPFFFDVKGKEILSRYIYGVIEADWLDELSDDVVSTDRRSVDWENDETAPFHTWGASKLGAWLDGFRKWRKENSQRDNVERVRRVNPTVKLTGTEEEAVAELLSDVFVTLGNDEEAKDKAAKSIAEAWLHEPTRRLTQRLWKEVFSPGGDANTYFSIVENLKKSLVPESLGLAVTIAQRISAITAMRRMIESDKTETHLQRLIEQFPWLIGAQWEHLTSNQTIRTLVTQKHKPDESAGEWSLDKSSSNLKPDFVFLSDAGTQREIIVIELKGPEAEKTLQPVEYDQLHQYLKIIRGVYTNVTLKGVLVGHDSGGFDEYDNRIIVRRWSDVLLEARALHVSYLEALLRVANPSIDDARLKQIADFGGQETMELLERLQSLEPYPDVVNESIGVDGQ